MQVWRGVHRRRAGRSRQGGRRPERVHCGGFCRRRRTSSRPWRRRIRRRSALIRTDFAAADSKLSESIGALDAAYKAADDAVWAAVEALQADVGDLNGQIEALQGADGAIVWGALRVDGGVHRHRRGRPYFGDPRRQEALNIVRSRQRAAPPSSRAGAVIFLGRGGQPSQKIVGQKARQYFSGPPLTNGGLYLIIKAYL